MNELASGHIVIDASVWVSRLVPQDVFHSNVKSWMETQLLNGQSFLSPAILLPEVAGAISRRTGDPTLANRAVDRLQKLPDLSLLEMNQSLILLAVKLAADLGVRGADSVYVATAFVLNLPLVTLDRDQMERAASAIFVQDFDF